MGVKGDGIKDLDGASGRHAEHECGYHSEARYGQRMYELNYEGLLPVFG
jgi:hypothetical protein